MFAHRVDVGCAFDLYENIAASIFSVEVSRVRKCAYFHTELISNLKKIDVFWFNIGIARFT